MKHIYNAAILCYDINRITVNKCNYTNISGNCDTQKICSKMLTNSIFPENRKMIAIARFLWWKIFEKANILLEHSLGSTLLMKITFFIT